LQVGENLWKVFPEPSYISKEGSQMLTLNSAIWSLHNCAQPNWLNFMTAAKFLNFFRNTCDIPILLKAYDINLLFWILAYEQKMKTITNYDFVQ
jgi:hypothetical protein